MSLFDDDRPKKPVAHEIGCDLTLLSAEELRARIDLLSQEISRLEEECGKKQAGKLAAESFFRK